MSGVLGTRKNSNTSSSEELNGTLDRSQLSQWCSTLFGLTTHFLDPKFFATHASVVEKRKQKILKLHNALYSN